MYTSEPDIKIPNKTQLNEVPMSEMGFEWEMPQTEAHKLIMFHLYRLYVENTQLKERISALESKQSNRDGEL